MKYPTLALLAGALFLYGPGSAVAQVTVKQAPPEAAAPEGLKPGDVVAPCPMEVDVPMGREGRDPSFVDAIDGMRKAPSGKPLPALIYWARDGMQHYVCHTERVARVTATRIKEKRGHLRFKVGATIMSGQWRQDVNLTISVLSPTGDTLCRKAWEDLTVGEDHAYVPWVAMASHTKTPEVECDVDAAKFAAMFTDQTAPKIVVMLAPKVDKEGR